MSWFTGHCTDRRPLILDASDIERCSKTIQPVDSATSVVCDIAVDNIELEPAQGVHCPKCANSWIVHSDPELRERGSQRLRSKSRRRPCSSSVMSPDTVNDVGDFAYHYSYGKSPRTKECHRLSIHILQMSQDRPTTWTRRAIASNSILVQSRVGDSSDR